MRKNIALSLFTFFLLLVILEVGLRIAGFKAAHYGYEKLIPVVKPDSIYFRDNILGWRLGIGKFQFFNNDSLTFECNINSKRNRITGQNDLSSGYIEQHNLAKKIHLYGCSFTFGVDVSDNSNYPYYLQSMLPDYIVCNKGVPRYSTVQMYLSLVNDVEQGNKPDIAVINYSPRIHDERTVLSRSWQNQSKWLSGKSKNPYCYEIDYPYAKLLNHDSISIEYLKWQDWSEDFPFRDNSVLINIVNTAYNNLVYKINKKNYDRINLLCLYKILDYCKQNGIQAVYYGLTGDADLVLDSLNTKGAITKLSSVDVKRKGYNCAPLDDGHPSAKAYRIYAEEVFDCMVLNKLINGLAAK